MTVSIGVLVSVLLGSVALGFVGGLYSKFIIKKGIHSWIKDQMKILDDECNRALKQTQEECNKKILQTQHELLQLQNQSSAQGGEDFNPSSLN